VRREDSGWGGERGGDTKKGFHGRRMDKKGRG